MGELQALLLFGLLLVGDCGAQDGPLVSVMQFFSLSCMATIME